MENAMPLKRVIEDGTEDDDTEGNRRKFFVSPDGVEDDTEGNSVRGRPAPALTDDDDTEGNAFRH